jgi:hypothetical protein
VGLEVGVGVVVAVGDAVGVGGGPDCAQYLQPVSNGGPPMLPPQTIISLPVQIAVCESRAAGALMRLVGIQLSIPGLYLPPVFKRPKSELNPPHTIIWLPVHTAV